MLGIHSEGPYLSPDYKALMDERYLRDPVAEGAAGNAAGRCGPVKDHDGGAGTAGYGVLYSGCCPIRNDGDGGAYRRIQAAMCTGRVWPARPDSRIYTMR